MSMPSRPPTNDRRPPTDDLRRSSSRWLTLTVMSLLKQAMAVAMVTQSSVLSPQSSALPPIDRTPKHYIGGKQARPDSGYSRPVYDARGRLIGEVGDGNRKDIRNAVEAARGAAKWADQTAHNRAQILYYIAENLSARA